MSGGIQNRETLLVCFKSSTPYLHCLTLQTNGFMNLTKTGLSSTLPSDHLTKSILAWSYADSCWAVKHLWESYTDLLTNTLHVATYIMVGKYNVCFTNFTATQTSPVPRPLPDFISQPWRKIGRKPGIKTMSQTVFVLTDWKWWTRFVLTQSTISGLWRSFDPRPSHDFSPRLWEKIWEWPGEEANSNGSMNKDGHE